jgi:site-specific recombinase XerD
MNNYIEYLEKKGFSTKSIPTYLSPIKNLESWSKQYGTSIETIDYKTFLLYLETLNKRVAKRTIVGYLGSLNHYFNYLQNQNYRSDNPIENLKIKGIPKKTVIKNILDFEELENLYYLYESENASNIRKRNKIILGLMIYQGIKSEDIYNLKLENVKLQKGQIEIQTMRKSNGRILNLMAWQFMDIQEYQNQIRPGIIYKDNLDTEQFFLSQKGRLTLRNSLKSLHDELKTYNRNYQSFDQIRTSVIVNWLGQYNLRKVQYLAGHRYISSTERYKQDNLESLQDMIDSFHPIK